MAKLTRERKLRERRLDKQAKKQARKQASADYIGEPGDSLSGETDETGEHDAGQTDEAGQTDLTPVVHRLPDA